MKAAITDEVNSLRAYRWAHDIVDAIYSISQKDFEQVAALLISIRTKGQVYFIGNGGSAAIASHMAIDFFNKGRFATRSFYDLSALTCLGNDYGFKSIFDMQLARIVKSGDVLVAISSSGESDDIIRATETAKLVTHVVTFSGFSEKNRLKKLGNFNFHVPSRNYGIVETAHLGLLHALLEAVTP